MVDISEAVRRVVVKIDGTPAAVFYEASAQMIETMADQLNIEPPDKLLVAAIDLAIEVDALEYAAHHLDGEEAEIIRKAVASRRETIEDALALAEHAAAQLRKVLG